MFFKAGVPYFFGMLASFYFAFLIWYPRQTVGGEFFLLELEHFLVIFILWLFVYYIYGLFEPENYLALRVVLFRLALSAIFSSLLAVLYFYAQPSLFLTPRRFLLLVLVLNLSFGVLWSQVLRKYFSKIILERIYVYSGGDLLPDVIRELEKKPRVGTIFSGYIGLGDIREDFFAEKPGEIKIIFPEDKALEKELVDKIFKIRTHGVMLYGLEQFYEDIFRRVRLSRISKLWFLLNVNTKYNNYSLYAKRVIDLFFGVLGFIIFILSFPIFALAIKLSSSGPALFKQTRVGLNEKVFTLYKYRTMKGVVNDTWTKMADPRITQIGKILRASRLDELPQSINLILGNMSLVGPRPEQQSIVEKLEDEIPFFSERHQVKPGLTGWAQLHIYASSLEDTKRKLEYDLYYIKHRSLWFDLEIIAKTVYHVLSGQGR